MRRTLVQGLLIYLHFSHPFYRTQILAAHLLEYKEDGDLGLHKNKSIMKQQAHINCLASAPSQFGESSSRSRIGQTSPESIISPDPIPIQIGSALTDPGADSILYSMDQPDQPNLVAGANVVLDSSEKIYVKFEREKDRWQQCFATSFHRERDGSTLEQLEGATERRKERAPKHRKRNVGSYSHRERCPKCLADYLLLSQQDLNEFTTKLFIRAIFCEKFLLCKVFPLRCLKWILQFSVLGCPPSVSTEKTGQNRQRVLDIVQRMIGIWCKREFVRSTSIEQQAYITAAIGLCLEGRLESADNLVRKMASSIALVFSRIIDPKNPLYLDDICGEMVDWDFGLGGASSVSLNEESCNTDSQPSKIVGNTIDYNRYKDVGENMRQDDISIFKSEIVDPDEVIDPVVLLNDNFQAERGVDDSDDGCSENSEGSSDSSLQPYDLADDDADLQRNFSQLGDLIAAVKKSDDADGVERALHVAEALIRASPDELRHSAGDLASTLVRIRCSDLTIDGEEESAEEKRQKALVALLVTCPFESLDSLNKLLYSPNLDVSQRFLIIDVMTNAAQELADTKTMRVRTCPTNLISPISGKQPWFLPSSRGPPGVGPWKEVSETDSHLSWSHRYERVLPSKSSQVKGKSRRWSLRTVGTEEHGAEWSKNKFPLYAAAFMLPSMQTFDRKIHGVDLLDRDFIVLGKLIYMLGVCMKCIAMHPEASALAPALLDMLSSRKVSHHPEAYVRRSVLFAASCILVALHPSYVASALIEGNQDISKGLEWIRTWALHISESDSDTECSSVLMRGTMNAITRLARTMNERLDAMAEVERYRMKLGIYGGYDMRCAAQRFTPDGYEMPTASCGDHTSNFKDA
ncbi:hypothetical protein Taro_005760 [Colocasia esculenta]|uniref:Telomere length regulation protein conserved domain-containing protein n=1 Tax=Colocasia esculenta TaxID=4460 RepID=A0A843TV70_COLES|nr:hypothetical protein [Colocasia esculenta]